MLDDDDNDNNTDNLIVLLTMLIMTNSNDNGDCCYDWQKNINLFILSFYVIWNYNCYRQLLL
jgi:hypothetical protein